MPPQAGFHEAMPVCLLLFIIPVNFERGTHMDTFTPGLFLLPDRMYEPG